MEKKFTLDLDDLRVETFTPRQWVRTGARGTVFAHDPSDECATSAPTCPGQETCDATCNHCTILCGTADTCKIETCGNCSEGPDCTDFTCGACDDTQGDNCTECEVGDCTDSRCCPPH